MMWQEIKIALAGEFSDFGDVETATRVTVRLISAVLLGALLGYERAAAGKAAGLRTHMLVALGAAMFVVAPIEWGISQASTSRVIQGLIAGIGFLGAGAIVKGNSGEEIHGLTTAASIWMTAALGLAAGLGRGMTALIAALLALLILRVLSPAEPKKHKRA